MKRNSLLVVALGVLFLSFIQLAGTLVESIYLMDLLHSTLDAKVVAVLFFFSPLLLLPILKKIRRKPRRIKRLKLLKQKQLQGHHKGADNVLF